MLLFPMNIQEVRNEVLYYYVQLRKQDIRLLYFVENHYFC